MKNILYILILITGCATNLSSKESIIFKENILVNQSSQNELFNSCVKWITKPSNKLTLSKFEKTKIMGTGTVISTNQELNITIGFKFKIKIHNNNLDIIYHDYNFDKNKDVTKIQTKNLINELEVYLKELTKSLKNTISKK